eukprot:6279287-Alexandrium_andersonii.AAC.1
MIRHLAETRAQQWTGHHHQGEDWRSSALKGSLFWNSHSMAFVQWFLDGEISMELLPDPSTLPVASGMS